MVESVIGGEVAMMQRLWGKPRRTDARLPSSGCAFHCIHLDVGASQVGSADRAKSSLRCRTSPASFFAVWQANTHQINPQKMRAVDLQPAACTCVGARSSGQLCNLVPLANIRRPRQCAAQMLRSRLPAIQPNDHVAIYQLLRIMTDETISTVSHRLT
ncbi:hypothetical protein PMIN06_000817 [Paraphaeosphaeria minitans]